MTVENGCLYVAPGSHRLGLSITHTSQLTFLSRTTVRGTAPGVQLEDVIALTIEQGSVVILPGTTYHKSEVNRTGTETLAALRLGEWESGPSLQHDPRAARRLDADPVRRLPVIEAPVE